LTIMLAIQAERAGGPEVLAAVELPVPTPGPGQVLVRHKAIGLNFIDTYHRSGLYPLKMPAVLGQEGAGLVEAVGEGVTRFAAGDRVAYGTGPMGAYAEAHVVPEGRLVRLPAAVSFESAAAAMLKGMTTEFLIRRCYPVKAGETILVHAAAGGVGGLMTQWAKHLGARVIGTVGSEDKAALVRDQGCDEVILYRTEDVAARVKAITGGKGVPVVYDGVGAATFEGSLASLARRGVLVSYGNASGPAPAVEPVRLMRGGSLWLTRPTLFDYVATTEELDASAAALFEVIASGAVKVPIGQTFSLKDAKLAHEALEGRSTVGATLLIP
jgi:NADPH2:quinone reductase